MLQKSHFNFILILLFLLASIEVQAQSNAFNSGSTGADGAFSPTTSQTITVPESGVFNYTTVNIPSGVSITYARNSKNTPVTILASGNVTIAGVISLDGKSANANGWGGLGGPGGFNGGSGGYGADPSFNGTTGDGPGGGQSGSGSNSGLNVSGGGGGGYAAAGGSGFAQNANVPAGQGGARYGTIAVSPLIGGSAGGGGGAHANNNGGGGGGGAGAILIASSGTINITGGIYARGGSGGNASYASGDNCSQSYDGGGGGGGAGGAIRMVSNIIIGGGTFYAYGGGGGGSSSCNNGVYANTSGGDGSSGYVRVEAYDFNNFNPNSNPSFVSLALPQSINTATSPSLRITSIGGIAPPANPLGSLQGIPDIVVPTTQTNPVTVNVTAANIPVGTLLQVTVTPANGTRTTVQSSALGGTESASTASASVTIPNGVSVVTASVTIDLTGTAANRNPIYINGEKVVKIEIAATFGQESQITYITGSGKRIAKFGL